MRVLVTRPEPAAGATAERLEALGHRPVLLPLAEAVHDRSAARAAFDAPFEALVATSAEVFRVLTPVPRTVTDRPVFCVGPATGKAAAAAGFRTIAIADGTGLSLADLIEAAFSTPPVHPLLYLAGEPRSPDLETRLAETNIPLRMVVCYRMRDLPESETDAGRLLAESPPDAVLLYSRESASRFFRLPAVLAAPERLAGTHFLCISGKTASAVPARFADHVQVAGSPDEDSLLALLPRPSSQI
ncbi:uroporphyrinogen-III synthase [Rhizobiaceae bacterium BDR2-2]|uniref:Uroporphyrinogen-III synthase n=1 Tax=Ectorhizobium quercum TaxID=2965071 RepID=A0AAE3N3H6_9HYPH|nr:uroporphyrinogen-III synthase [Ectorhizobium quercum]MCX8999252.1 uroporphyrinogen-III synthase [Ectorhizobium quercum]